ncbi:hypothetical protein EV121DRAFT_214776 [Schizophyllum commune]
MQPPNSRATHVNAHTGSTAVCHSRLQVGFVPTTTDTFKPAMFNDSGVRYSGYISDGACTKDSLPPQDSLFDVTGKPWSQPAHDLGSYRHAFDQLSSTQRDDRCSDGEQLGFALQYPQHAPLRPVDATSQLDDIFPFDRNQHNATTSRLEHLQYDPAPACTPEHASLTAHNTPFGLEARLPSSDTATLRPWNPQHAAPDAPNADMYYGPLQASRYGEHSAGRPTQRAIKFARQPEPGVCFGDTLNHPADVTAASVRSEDPFAHSTWSMPFAAESSFEEFSTQSPPSPLLYSHSVPAASSPFRTRYDSPMNSLDFGAFQNMPEVAMPQAVVVPLEANILNTCGTSDGQTPPAVARSSSLGGPGRAPIVAPSSRLDVTHK